MDEFWDVWEHIETFYVPQPAQYSPEGTKGKEKPDRADLVHGAINGLTKATGDTYTNFFLPKDAKDFESQVIDGEVEGIGTYITITDERLVVVKPIAGGPAMKAGLRTDDIILTIDGVPSSTYNLSEAADAIRGPRGSNVLLTIYRPILDETFDVTVTRDSCRNSDY